jgi:hypothetical protein
MGNVRWTPSARRKKMIDPISNLRKFCTDNGINFPNEYIQSFEKRFNRSRLARDHIRNQWKNIELKTKEQNLIRLDNELVSELIDTSALYIEAMMNIAYSLFEIYAQVINICFLNEKYTVDSCSFANIVNDLANIPSIKKKIENINKSEEKKYVFAYMNTTKHRELINTKWSFIKNESGEYIGPVVNCFTYNGDTFNEKNLIFLTNAIEKIKEQLMDLLLDVMKTKGHQIFEGILS